MTYDDTARERQTLAQLGTDNRAVKYPMRNNITRVIKYPQRNTQVDTSHVHPVIHRRDYPAKVHTYLAFWLLLVCPRSTATEQYFSI